MGDSLNIDDYKNIKMGASSNQNALRLTTLQDKKKSLEETIAKRNKELKELCLKEAELTGITPTEIPSENGESPPLNRRKVGTSYQLNFVNNANVEEESISTLEVQLQLHARMAEAAIGLANETNSSKTLRRQRMSEYDHHKTQYNILQEKLNQLQGEQQPSSINVYQQKQKKKPRPTVQEDAVSVNLSVNDLFGKSVLRHSMRSLQHPLYSTNSNEYKFSSHPKLTYRSSDENLYIENIQQMNNEDSLISNFYKLNLLKEPDQLENLDTSNSSGQYIPSSSSTLSSYQQNVQYSKSQNHMLHQSSPQMISPSGSYDLNAHSDYYQYKLPQPGSQGQLHKNSPSLCNQKISYSSSTSSQYHYSYPYSCEQPRSYNPLQIQPHQQYEHDVMTSGLGGYWKKKENGDMTWCNVTYDNIWQRDKRCGSLDRRKNKRIHKRISPSVEVKCAILSSVPIQNEPNRNAAVETHQNSFSRSRQDNCPLVRTQSLGSVGVQTVDSVWPSDDNSSCGSETHSFNEYSSNARKQKQKEWYETSLDDPVPCTPRPPRSLSTIPSIMPDVKYTDVPILNYTPSQIQKCVLEIPAESKPSPKMSETNVELFSNNIPKNCTVVTAGRCKPYHEETKPFEMSDFYKYSTKFKKSPSKENAGVVIQKGVYQPLQPMTCQPFSPIVHPNSNMVYGDTSLIANQSMSTSDFQPEINTWYKNEDRNDNTNKNCSHSTATLV